MRLDRIKLLTLLMFTFTMGVAAAGAADDGPSVSDQLEALDLRKGGAVTWIKYHQITGWTQLDDKHVMVNGGESGNFLLRLRNRCRHLGPSMDVSFTASVGNVTTADRINVENDSGFRDFCYITAINRLEPR
jgi:hypothetical protein